MSEFEHNDCETTNSKQNKNACTKALRLDFEKNQERSGLSFNSISVIAEVLESPGDGAKLSDSPENTKCKLDAKRQLSGTTNDTRYSLGVDFVITALLAVAGITKVRQPSSKEIAKETFDKNPSPTQDIQYSLASSSGYWPNHEQKRSTIIIGIHDCLNKIANTIFQDPNLGWLIADLNKHRISERIDGKLRVVSIAALQILDMPMEEEIINFQKTRPNDFCAENLVTIVLQNTIDKSKLEESLAPVVPKLNQG